MTHKESFKLLWFHTSANANFNIKPHSEHCNFQKGNGGSRVKVNECLVWVQSHKTNWKERPFDQVFNVQVSCFRHLTKQVQEGNESCKNVLSVKLRPHFLF